jgi:cell division septation protein DedD
VLTHLASPGISAPHIAGKGLSASYSLVNLCSEEPGRPLASDSVDQAAQQMRPRRVNPGDPAAEPPTVPHPDKPSGSSRRGAGEHESADPKKKSGGRQPKGASRSYAVQIGAFLQLENAQRLAESAGRKGYSARVVTISDSHGKKWHCVRAGNYPDQDQARKSATEIEGKLKVKTIIRPSNSL